MCSCALLDLQPRGQLVRSASHCSLHSRSRSGSHDQLEHLGPAQRIAAEVEEEEQELCYHK